jgi:Zn-dependent protease with chaperone function
MRRLRWLFLPLVVPLCLACGLAAQDSPQPGSDQNASVPATVTQLPAASASVPPTSFDQVVERIVEREHFFVAQMRHLHPLVETYIQNMKADKDMGAVPVGDHYFLGRLDMSQGTEDRSFTTRPGLARRMLTNLTSLYSLHFLPLGFAQMVMLDDDFQRKYYNLNFVRREFIGETRCLVIDVQPKPGSGKGRFLGRIWVEDQDYNIVRFNGTYTPHANSAYYLHFDSWRLNMRPGVWLPAYVYSEESDLKYRMSQNLRFKAQTRLWGYDLKNLGKTDEFTTIQVDSPQTIRDQSETAQDATPVEAERLWQHQAEENALERLQKIGLLAPPGEVDKVLTTVVNNLIVTNNLDIQPEVRARVLLTAPLESFTIGHTIVVSRGLLDVLPDEASLAMILARELSHIALGHQMDTKFAFNDRMFFADEDTFSNLNFRRSRADEDAADKKALELLANSPYKDKLSNAGLFLKALQERAPDLKNLIQARLGAGLVSGKTLRMAELLNTAPQLDERKKDQIAALPLGGRVKVDPWSNQTTLAKSKPVALLSAREKMPFEITPVFPYLTRIPNAGTEKVAATAPVTSAPQAK